MMVFFKVNIEFMDRRVKLIVGIGNIIPNELIDKTTRSFIFEQIKGYNRRGCIF